MYCTRCGKKNPDNSKFCSNCGTRLEPLRTEAKGTDQSTKISFSGQQNRKEETQDSGKQKNKPELRSIEKENSRGGFRLPEMLRHKVAIFAIAFLLIVGIAGVFAVNRLTMEEVDEPYVYLADGKYELVKNAGGRKSIALETGATAYQSSNAVVFSPEKKYLYYYSDYNTSEGYGTICCVEYGKLKSIGKSSRYIQTIGRGWIPWESCFITEDTFVYWDDTSSLCYYDGKKSHQVAGNAERAVADRENNYWFTPDSPKLSETETFVDIGWDMEDTWVVSDRFPVLRAFADAEGEI